MGSPAAEAWRRFRKHRMAVVSVFVLALIVFAVLAGPPTTAAEAFRLLQSTRLVGLLRLDLPPVLALPLYYVLFGGLLAALWQAGRALAAFSTALAFAGVTLIISAPTALSMATLGDKYTAASSEAARSQLLAAGEALLAADIWHGTGAILGGVFLQAAGVLICIVMLRGTVFGRFTAWLGIVMYAADLGHILARLSLPAAGFVLMALAGPLYPVWFFLVGRALARAGRQD